MTERRRSRDARGQTGSAHHSSPDGSSAPKPKVGICVVARQRRSEAISNKRRSGDLLVGVVGRQHAADGDDGLLVRVQYALGAGRRGLPVE